MIILCLFAVFSSSDVGTTVYPLLKIGVGPRAVALGEAYVGLSDDIIASYWNPAGLGPLKDLRFFVSHQEWFMDIRDEYFTIGMPAMRGYLAFSGIYSAVNGVEVWDENNIPFGSVNLWSGIFSAAYGQKIKANLAGGLGVKVVVEDLYEQRLADLVFDLGARLALNKNIRLGGVIKNLSIKTNIPFEIKLGGCYQGIRNLNLLLDLVLPSDNIPHVNWGGEYLLHPAFALRGGWRSGPYDISNLRWTSGFAAGFGVKYAGINFDYAFVPYGKLGLTHRLSISGGVKSLQAANQLIIVVKDGETGRTLEAGMNLSGVKEGTFSVDRTGKIEFKNLPSGWVIINTVAAGYPANLDSTFVNTEGVVKKEILLYKTKPGMIRGLVFDAVTKKPVRAGILYKGMAYGTIDNDTIAGSFVLRNMPPGLYELTVSAKDPKYIPQDCSIRVDPGRLVEKEFYLVRIREKIILKGVNFETGKADLKPEFFPVLDEAGKILLDNPDVNVEIAGHTDPREISTTDFPSNWELSLARADVVRKYLIETFSIVPERLSARGYADTQPIATNDTEEGMAQNRRTEFRILE
jgi:outer membrane protein OmpA-like peptidoglycan-associated protein